VHPLADQVALAEYQIEGISQSVSEDLVPKVPPPLPDPLPESVHATTFVFADASGLEKDIWSFEQFVKDKAQDWIQRTGF
jgi:hypothetical protein